jgi:hypothetical protein
MATIIMADDGIAFDGASLESGPLGGVESAFIGLAEAFAARGHRVLAFTRGTGISINHGVKWAPVDGPMPDTADLYVANRGHRLLDRVRQARATAFWLHNPARHLLKWRNFHRLVRRRPVLVFLGEYHLSTYPGWAPGGRRVVIPLGLSAAFCPPAETVTAIPMPPRATFTSNPLRGLDALVELWRHQIRPAVPNAELHVFSGLATYRGGADRHAARIAMILGKAAAAPGVILREPLAKPALAALLPQFRAMLYPGDPGETFCLAVAEAQAMGVPAVVGAVASLPERVVHGVTGTVARNPADFAASAIGLLSDDGLWREQHRQALSRGGRSWDEVAGLFEALLP